MSPHTSILPGPCDSMSYQLSVQVAACLYLPQDCTEAMVAEPLHLLHFWCSDHENLLEETLEKQFEVVKERVSRNGTYMQGSHVLQFGSLAIDEEPAADYLGQDNTGKPRCCCDTPCPLCTAVLATVTIRAVAHLRRHCCYICSFSPQ